VSVKLKTDNKNAEFHERCVVSADMWWCEWRMWGNLEQKKKSSINWKEWRVCVT